MSALVQFDGRLIDVGADHQGDPPRIGIEIGGRVTHIVCTVEQACTVATSMLYRGVRVTVELEPDPPAEAP